MEYLLSAPSDDLLKFGITIESSGLLLFQKKKEVRAVSKYQRPTSKQKKAIFTTYLFESRICTICSYDYFSFNFAPICYSQCDSYVVSRPRFYHHYLASISNRPRGVTWALCFCCNLLQMLNNLDNILVLNFEQSFQAISKQAWSDNLNMKTFPTIHSKLGKIQIPVAGKYAARGTVIRRWYLLESGQPRQSRLHCQTQGHKCRTCWTGEEEAGESERSCPLLEIGFCLRLSFSTDIQCLTTDQKNVWKASDLITGTCLLWI